MARVIEPGEVTRSPEIWDELLDGSTWEFNRDDDYTGSSDLLIRRLRYQASIRGLKIRVVWNHFESFGIVAYTP
jgi:hypothetical protein